MNPSNGSGILPLARIITGERLQSIADVYIGKSQSCFHFNPWIYTHSDKHKYLSDFENGQPYYNPRIVFCYGYLIKELSEIIHLFTNPFVLITHNCDENMAPNKPEIDYILNTPNLICWYSQNVGIIRDNLHFLPIGIANSQWPHGNLEVFRNIDLYQSKTEMTYMNFNINTNPSVRQKCYDILANKIPFLPTVDFYTHIHRLSKYKFCICPIGNGFDTHRLWECYYLRVVPIMLKNTFTINIKNTTGLPMILLDSWEDYDSSGLLMQYENFDFDSCSKFLDLQYYITNININISE
jgi:hypothetical protein